MLLICFLRLKYHIDENCFCRLQQHDSVQNIDLTMLRALNTVFRETQPHPWFKRRLKTSFSEG